MNKNKKFNLKKLFSLLAVVTLAFCLVFSVACGNNTDNSSSSSSGSDDDDAKVTATDYQTIKNGDFEFGTSAKDVTYPVYTGINWTRYRDNSYPTSAMSSTKNSGIIDTEEEAYNKIAESNNFPKDGDKYWNPKTPESYGLGDKRYVFDEETYETNPNEDKLCTSGTKILMIHNVTSVAGRGTAQKFVSSSSLTTTTGYGKLSVWVMTKDLKSLQQNQEFGAYISVNNTLSSSRSPFLVKNINTNGVWANYVIYLKTSDYASSSFTVTVGLGFGSDTYKAEYVEGFAYFDEIHYQEIDKETFETETANGATEYSLFDESGEVTPAEELKVSEWGKTYVANENGQATTVKYTYSHLMNQNEFALELTGDYNKVYMPNPDGYATGADAGMKAYNEVAVDGVTNPYGETAQTAYIKLANPSSYTLTSNIFQIANKSYKQYNFLTNVDVALKGQPGAKIVVEEVNQDGSKVYGTVDVATNYETYSAEEKANVWKKVSVFVKNDLGTTRYIRFKFTLGTTDNVFDATDYALTKGYALFTGFNERSLPESEYNIVSSPADYKSTITLGYDYPNGPTGDEEETNSFAFNATTATSTDLNTKPATGVAGYTGVVGNHTMVGGDKNGYFDANVISGVVSSKYAPSYESLVEDEKTVIDLLANGENIQPLLVKNTVASSFGYLGSQLTLSANTTTLVSVQVKVLSGSAYVYLANADPLSDFSVLQVAEKPLVVKVTADSQPTATSKWVTVNFVVTTGDEDVSYRVELWNGSRDGAALSQGTVLFNQVTTTTEVNLTNMTAKLEASFVSSDSDVVKTEYTRKPTVVTYTDANGEKAEYTRTYAPTVVLTQYVKGSSIIASYATIHAPETLDETTSSDTDSDSSSSDTTTTTPQGPSTNVALQIVSIVIAAVLIVVLAVVIIRMIVKKNKKAEVSQNNLYNRNSRENVQAIINQNKAKRAQKELEAKNAENAETAETPTSDTVENESTEETAEEKPYDYDNPENNI